MFIEAPLIVAKHLGKGCRALTLFVRATAVPTKDPSETCGSFGEEDPSFGIRLTYSVRVPVMCSLKKRDLRIGFDLLEKRILQPYRARSKQHPGRFVLRSVRDHDLPSMDVLRHRLLLVAIRRL